MGESVGGLCRPLLSANRESGVPSMMIRPATIAAPILLLAILLTGCERSYQDEAPSAFFVADEGLDAPVTPSDPNAAGAAQGSRGAAGGREPAVLFVAFAATPADVVDRMLKMAEVTKDDVVYDLGCGDGRIVVAAAKEYGCRAVGYDLDRLRVREARINVLRNKVAHLVTIKQRDVLKADLRQATVVTLYLGTELNARLVPQLRQLRPGARVVSHEFGLGDLPPDKTVEMDSRLDDLKHKIHLWTCPLPPQGG